MLLLLDNYDSFTYNVYQLLAELGAEVEVVRNDVVTVDELMKRGYSGVVISPGPGEPKDSGVTEDLIREMKGRVPILGVCLGHQAIGEVFGGKVVRAPKIVHGKSSRVRHGGDARNEVPPGNLGEHGVAAGAVFDGKLVQRPAQEGIFQRGGDLPMVVPGRARRCVRHG